MNTASEPNVTSLRWLLSFFFGGVGCLLPYLSLHSRAVGFSLRDAYVLSIASPFIAAIGPLVAGPALDRFYSKKKSPGDFALESNACIRFTLATTIFLSAAFYSFLLTVPPVPKMDSEQSQITFVCDDRGAFLLQDQCDSGCRQYQASVSGPVRLGDCAFHCTGSALPRLYYDDNDDSLETEIHGVSLPQASSTSTFAPPAVSDTHPYEPEPEVPNLGLAEPDLDAFFDGGPVASVDDEEDLPKWEGSGDDTSDEWVRRERRHADATTTEEPLPPHICFGDTNKRMCSVYTPYSASVRVNVSLRKGYEQNNHCYYPLGGHFSCRIPSHIHGSPEQCIVRCELEDEYVAGSALLPSQCEKSNVNAPFSFWLYLLFRSLGDLFTSTSISLLIGACLTASKLRIGREFVMPAVTYALMTSLVGYMHSPGLGPDLLTPLPPFILALAGFALFSVLSVVVLLFSSKIPIGPPDWWTSSNTVRFRHKSELFGLLLVLLLLGVLWGPYYSHVPWHMSGTANVEAYIGTSLALGALLSVPFVWKADIIIDFCGYSNILIAGFTFYILRYTGLLLICSPWVLFITGCLEVFTLSLVFFSAVLYIRHLVPKHLTFTTQSLGFVAHFCIGNSIGCLIAHMVSPATPVPLPDNTNNTTHSLAKHLASDEEFQHPYYLLYCGGAVLAAVIAAVYFLLYHVCLKKRCLAPHYRKPPEHQPAAVLQGPTRNGTYTPLLVFTNGRPNHATPD